MNRDEFVRVCRDYADAQGCRLNPDNEFLDNVIDGIMKKQGVTGLRYCPCRLGTEWEFLCPCDFQAQETWKNKGMCWCGLFVKK
ncbi:ferredoxin-thioredoxin reductase catalytic domain-containing protein [archaeon]